MEYLLNYKILSGLTLLDKNWCELKVNEICEPKSILHLIFLIGSHANQLPYFFHNLNGIQTSRISVQVKDKDKTKQFVNVNLYNYKTNTTIVFGKLDILNAEDCFRHRYFPLL